MKQPVRQLTDYELQRDRARLIRENRLLRRTLRYFLRDGWGNKAIEGNWTGTEIEIIRKAEKLLNGEKLWTDKSC